VLVSDISANKALDLPPSCYFRYDQPLVDNLREALADKLKETSPPVYDLSLYDWDRIAAETARIYELM